MEAGGTELLALAVGELQQRGDGFFGRERNWAARNRVRWVSPGVNRFVLFRWGKLRMALKFTKTTDKEQGGAEYVCYSQPAPEGPFDSASLKVSKGEVFEKYRYEKNKDGSRNAIDDGGKLAVACGPFTFQWSTKTIVYLPDYEDPYHPSLEVATTSWSELKDVDFQQKKLQWCRILLSDYRDAWHFDDEVFYGGHVVRAPFRRFVLLRRGGHRMALMLLPSIKLGREATEYICYWQPDSQAIFSDEKSLKTIQGELIEKYRTIKKEGNKTWLQDAGSKLSVDCGPIQIKWSSEAHLYFPRTAPNDPTLEIAETTWTALEEVDFQMKTLKWYKASVKQP